MVKNLKVLGSEAWNLMREGEAEKQVMSSFSYLVIQLHIFMLVILTLVMGLQLSVLCISCRNNMWL